MQKKEICWNITTRCNQKCRYCHRFLNIEDLTFDDNMKILDNLIEDGVTDITWTGGEALMYNNIDKLIEKSYKNGINNKLITNGKILAQNNMDIIQYLDSLTLSVDSIDDEINEKLGRGKEHFSNVLNILNFIKDNDINIKLRINTVINKINIYYMNEFIDFLNNYKIYEWRIFRFMPLREMAIKNKMEFDISDEEFNFSKANILRKSKLGSIEFRELEDMEKKYILLVANGDIIITENGKDIRKGNALYEKVSSYM